MNDPDRLAEAALFEARYNQALMGDGPVMEGERAALLVRAGHAGPLLATPDAARWDAYWQARTTGPEGLEAIEAVGQLNATLLPIPTREDHRND